jgi:hypothetical protein
MARGLWSTGIDSWEAIRVLAVDPPVDLALARIALGGDAVILEGREEAAPCPAWRPLRRSVHERYRRRPLDLH